MSCNIKRDKQGKVTKVVDKNNNDSLLFRGISSLPHIPNIEKAIEIYDEALKIDDSETNPIEVKVNENVYTDFTSALENADGRNIDFTYNGKTIYSVPSTLDERTVVGATNALILDGILDPNQTVYKGDTYYRTMGLTEEDRKISLEFLKTEIKKVLPRRAYKIVGGLVKIINKKITPSGENTLHNKMARDIADMFTSNTVLGTGRKIDENNLKLNLLQVLSDMGVPIISMNQYQERFKKNNENTPPSATALADIANRVIAFKDNQIPISELTEETMHFIVETLPQDTIDSYRDLVRESQEYKDGYDKYNKVYNGDQNLIEKEILGRIMKNIALERAGGKNQSFISKVIETISNFFQNLNLTSEHRAQLKQLNEMVDQFVVQTEKGAFNSDSLSQSRNLAVMYSLEDAISNTNETFKKTFKKLTDFGQFRSYVRELESFKSTENKNISLLVSGYLEKTGRLVEITDAALEQGEKIQKPLSGQNLAILRDLRDNITADLKTLSFEVSRNTTIDQAEKKLLVSKIQEYDTRIGEFQELNESISKNKVRQLAEQYAENYGTQEREYFLNQVEEQLGGRVKDVNTLFSYFGQLHHSSSPILNLISTKLFEVDMIANQGMKEDVSELLNYMDENGYTNKDLAEFQKDGYFLSEVDQKAFDEKLIDINREAFNEAIGENKYPTLEEYRKDLNDNKLPEFTKEQYREYVKLQANKRLSVVERQMNIDYYKEQEARYAKGETTITYLDGSKKTIKGLGVSKATQVFLKDLSSSRTSIRQKAKDENGRVILSEEDKRQISYISKIRKSRKDIHSETSTLKDGLDLTPQKPSNKESVKLRTGNYLSLKTGAEWDSLDDDSKDAATIAFDIHRIDEDYANREKDDTVKKSLNNFSKYITKLSESDEYSWKDIEDIILSNTDLSLSQKFYDTLNGDSFINSDELVELNPGKESIIEELKNDYAKKNSILAVNRNSSSPIEIDRMSESAQNQIRSLSASISTKLRLLTLPKSEAIQKREGERSTNLAYKDALKKQNNITEGTKEELRFITEGNHAKVKSLDELELAFARKQKSLSLTDKQEKLLDKYQRNELWETKLAYLKDNLYEYYTRFAPIGYQSLKERVNSGENPVVVLNDLVNNEYIDVRVDYSFDGSKSPYDNPGYRTNYDGGFNQPKKGTFVNKEYFQRFGIDKDGNPTKDIEKHKLLRLYIETRKKTLEKQEQKGANPYRVVQISATNTEKMKKLAANKGKKATLSALLNDTFAYRVDDIAYGVEDFRENRNLPKYYTKDLEEQSDVSTDYIYGIVAATARANEYRAKKDLMSDIDALQETLYSIKRNSRSKNFKNTIAMADSVIDGYIFGKVESKPFEVKIPGISTPVDFTKTLRVLQKFTTIRNLGYSFMSPITGLFTGTITKRVEQFIGDKLNNDAARLATIEFNKLGLEGAKNAMDYNDNSKMFLMGQSFGIWDISRKARNAKYSQTQRAFSKSALGAFSIADYPIKPKIMIGILFDNRIVDGRIMTRQQFLQEGIREGKNEDDLKEDWKGREKDAIYNYMDFSKTGFNWKPSIEEYGLDKDYLKRQRGRLQLSVSEQVSNIDGQIAGPLRIRAQRHALLSTTLQHKSFLTILASNRFKDRQINPATGLLEEGSWRTAGGVFSDFFNTEGNFMKKVENLRKSMEKREDESDIEWELRKRNLKRISIEMGSYLSLALLIATAMLLNDDDEDSWFQSISNLLMIRTLNESASNLSFNMVSDIGGTIESPIVMYDSATKLAKFWQAFDFRDIEGGRYSGETRSSQYLRNIIPPYKSVYDLMSAENIRETRQSYELYNKGASLNASTLGILPIFDSIKDN